MRKSIDQIMRTAPVIPVIVIERVDDAVPMAEALVAGGLAVLEVTLRTPAALEAMAGGAGFAQICPKPVFLQELTHRHLI